MSEFWLLKYLEFNRQQLIKQVVEGINMEFNEAQLVTERKAIAFRDYINKTPLYDGSFLGGGVKPLTTWPTNSGIFKPEWVGGPASFPEPTKLDPTTGEREFAWLFRFNNGAEGINIGLMMDKFKRYPMSPAYVLNSFRTEIDSMAK